MKTSKRQDLIDLARDLNDVRELIRDLKAREDEIKTRLKACIGDSGALSLPGWLLTLTHRTRADWDKTKLMGLLAEKAPDYQVIREYETLEIKKV